MKKYLLFGLLYMCFIFLLASRDVFNIVPTGEVVGTGTATTQVQAETNAQNDFRRQLLVFLSNYYKEALGEYYPLWQASGQIFDRQMIDDLTRLVAKTNTTENTRSGRSYRVEMRLGSANFGQYIENIATEHQSPSSVNIREIDVSLSAPNAGTYQSLKAFTEYLQGLKVDYPAKLLIYKEKTIDIVINTNGIPPATARFNYNTTQITKSADRNGSINLKVSFDNTPADIQIPSNTQNATITFDIDITSTFGTQNLTHKAFIENLINTYLTDKSGTIEIFKIADSSFYITSDNFPSAVSPATDLLRSKDWQIGTAQSHTHLVKINKVTLEERRLNIGSYYAKAYLEMQIFDRQNAPLQSYKTKEIEAIDSASIENSHNKINRALLSEIGTLF